MKVYIGSTVYMSMPVFNDDLRILSREIQNYDPEHVPPLISLLLTGTSFATALIIALFFIFPSLRAAFEMPVFWALFLAIGSFILIHFALAQLGHSLFLRLRK